MSTCAICKRKTEIAREELMYTLKRDGLSTMVDGDVTLSDIKEHKFPLCRSCVGRDKRWRIVIVAIMLMVLVTGMVIIFKLTPNDDLWFLGAALVVGSFVFPFVVLRFFSDLGKLKKMALTERNRPGYTAMTKGDYDAFTRAAKWSRGEFD